MANSTTYYIVSEGLEKQEDGTVVPKKTYPTSDLSSLQKAHPLHTAASLEEWTRKVVASEDLQAALQISIREATDADVKGYGDKIRIFGAIEKARTAQERADQEKLEGQLEAVEFFARSVTTEQEATNFLAEFGFGAYAFSFWIKDVMEAKAKAKASWEFAPEAAQALADAWIAAQGKDAAKKKKVTTSKQYKSVIEWAA